MNLDARRSRVARAAGLSQPMSAWVDGGGIGRGAVRGRGRDSRRNHGPGPAIFIEQEGGE